MGRGPVRASTTDRSVSSKIIANRPKFSDVWNAYPKGLQYYEVYELIGGNVYELYRTRPDSYTNACALRISEAFNKGNYVIKSGSDGFNGYREKGKTLSYSTLPNVQRNYYAYYMRVSDIILFLEKNFGVADEEFTDGILARDELIGKKGIVVFTIEGWGDATGHVALWDGSAFADGAADDYFNLVNDPSLNRGGRVTLKKVRFWELKD